MRLVAYVLKTTSASYIVVAAIFTLRSSPLHYEIYVVLILHRFLIRVEHMKKPRGPC